MPLCNAAHQELNAAATKIQAVQKGRKARAEVASMKTGEEGKHSTATENDEPEKLELHDGSAPLEVAETVRGWPLHFTQSTHLPYLSYL